MKANAIRSIAVLLALVIVAGQAAGFAEKGHQLVAYICEEQLTTTTRQAVREILGEQTLAEVSTWADAERSRDRSTATWHYIDYNIHTGRVEAEHAHQPTILDAISSQALALRQATSSTIRQRALKFLVHFVADLHQPLHCADNGDMGGNRTMVTLDGAELRLHHVWDSELVEKFLARQYPQMSLVEAARAISRKYSSKRDVFVAGTPVDWSRQSFAIARDFVYKLPERTSEAPGAVALDSSYVERSGAILEEQFAKAGTRLAYVLNYLLDEAFARSCAGNDPATTVGCWRERSAGELVPVGAAH